MDTQPFLTFLEQECLFHTTFGNGQIKSTFSLCVSELQISPIVSQQVDDLYTGLPRCSMEGGIQPLAMVNTGSLTKQMATTLGVNVKHNQPKM